MKKFAWLMVATLVLGLAISPASALAFTQRTGDNVTVTGPINDDLYVTGANIDVTSDVTGDVVAFGQDITITGDVSGDVIAAGAMVNVRGSVGGSVRAAGANVSIDGRVAEDVVAAGSNVRVTSDGSVGRDAVVGGSQVVLGGDVGRNVLAGAQELTIIGSVGGDVTADAGQVTVAPGASVAGDLTYYSADDATVNGTVGGQTQRFAPRNERGQAEESVASGILLAILGWVRALVGMLIFAVLVLLALRQFAERAASDAWARPGLSLGIGAAIFVSAFPVAILVFILGLIIGGWWIAFAWLAVVWLLAAVGIVIAALALGSWILGRASHSTVRPMVAALLGVLILSLIAAVPFLGWLAYFLAMLWGMGALVVAGYVPRREQAWSAPMAPPAAGPPVAPAAPPQQGPPMSPM